MKHINIKKRIIKISALVIALALILSACGNSGSTQGGAPQIKGLTFSEEVELKYAREFQIYRYKGGYSFININRGENVLVVPEGGNIPEDLPEDTVVIQQPLDRIYLVATSAMALFDAMDALDTIKFTGTKESDWYVKGAVDALQSGEMLYAGKYSAPDYEMLINNKVQLAVESTMIYHTPEVKEKMEELGIKTIVEFSSYETHPLGRTEWVKLYGEMIGKADKAVEVFEGQLSMVKDLEVSEKSEKTVAFFVINSSGNVVTYKSKSYVPEMIRIAGGKYIFDDESSEDENVYSTVNMNMETFYASAKDADYIIYNISSFGTPISTLDQLLEKSAVLADFKAVKEGHVWCTGRSMFQETDKMGSMIRDINLMLSSEEPDESQLQYLFKLK